MDVSLYLEINDSYYIEWASFQIKKNIEYLASKGLSYEIVCHIINKEISKKDVLEHLEDARFGSNKICKGRYIAVFIENLWYPDYRVHFQWRYLDFYNKNLSINTNSYTLIFNVEEDKTYIDMAMSERQALFYKRALNLDLNDPLCLRGHNLGIDEEVQLCIAIENRTTRSFLQVSCIMKLEPYEREFVGQK